MKVINFSHPLTAPQLSQIESHLNVRVEEVVKVRVNFDLYSPFVSQVSDLLNELGITPEEWRGGAWLIVPPSLNFITAVLLVELYNRMNRFPTIVRLRPVASALVSAFEVAEIIDLDGVRQPTPPPPAPPPVTREWRTVEYPSASGRFGVVLHAEWELSGSSLSKKWQPVQPIRGRVEVKHRDGFTHIKVIEDSSSTDFVVVVNGKGGADARTPDGRDCPPVASLTGDNPVQVFTLPSGSVVKVYGYKRRTSRTYVVSQNGSLKDFNPFE